MFKALFLVLAVSLFSTFALLGTGCTKEAQNEAACSVQSTVTDLASTVVSSQLECSNRDAVKASIDAELAKLKLCEKKGSVVGDMICQPVVDALSGTVLGVLPSSWGCSGGATVAEAKAKLLEECKKAL